MIKVIAIYMGIHAEQATDNGPHSVTEILGERNT